MILFYPNELVEMAEMVADEKGPAVSKIMSMKQHAYVYGKFGRNKFILEEEEYSKVMSLFLLFINEFIQTDGEDID